MRILARFQGQPRFHCRKSLHDAEGSLNITLVNTAVQLLGVLVNFHSAGTYH